jgi:hypothetical protein
MFFLCIWLPYEAVSAAEEQSASWEAYRRSAG